MTNASLDFMPCEDSDQPGDPTNRFGIFAVCLTDSKVPLPTSCGQAALIRLCQSEYVMELKPQIMTVFFFVTQLIRWVLFNNKVTVSPRGMQFPGIL